MKSHIPSIVFLFSFLISIGSCNESKIGDNFKIIETPLPHNDSIVAITTMVDSPSLNETVFEKNTEGDNPYEGFYDYEECNLDHEAMDLARTILTSDGVKLKYMMY